MSILRSCPFFRDSGTLNMGRGIEYCDFDCSQTTCDGDVQFCEKPDVLKKYLTEQRRKEGNLEWRGSEHREGNRLL
jgi:hypothetical protein